MSGNLGARLSQVPRGRAAVMGGSPKTHDRFTTPLPDLQRILAGRRIDLALSRKTCLAWTEVCPRALDAADSSCSQPRTDCVLRGRGPSRVDPAGFSGPGRQEPVAPSARSSPMGPDCPARIRAPEPTHHRPRPRQDTPGVPRVFVRPRCGRHSRQHTGRGDSRPGALVGLIPSGSRHDRAPTAIYSV